MTLREYHLCTHRSLQLTSQCAKLRSCNSLALASSCSSKTRLYSSHHAMSHRKTLRKPQPDHFNVYLTISNYHICIQQRKRNWLASEASASSVLAPTFPSPLLSLLPSLWLLSQLGHVCVDPGIGSTWLQSSVSSVLDSWCISIIDLICSSLALWFCLRILLKDFSHRPPAKAKG